MKKGNLSLGCKDVCLICNINQIRWNYIDIWIGTKYAGDNSTLRRDIYMQVSEWVWKHTHTLFILKREKYSNL